jgi:hypothetical protein
VEKYAGAQTVTVIQDVETRWWSTYDMVERLLYLKEALQKMHIDGNLKVARDKKSSPARIMNEGEWMVLDSIGQLLVTWKESQLMLESHNKVTSSLVLHVLSNLHIEFDEMEHAASYVDDDGETVHMAGITSSFVECLHLMMDDFTARWGDIACPFKRQVVRVKNNRQCGCHPYFCRAHALDPRFKHLDAITDESNRDELWTDILSEMIQAKVELSNSIHVIDDEPNCELDSEETGNDALEDITGFCMSAAEEKQPTCLRKPKMRQSKTFQRTALERRRREDKKREEREKDGIIISRVGTMTREEARNVCDKELQRYRLADQMPLHMPGRGDELSDPLKWWEKNSSSYPTLWLLARYYLAVPATSALSERCFSGAGQILTSTRNRMSSEVLENTFVVKRHMKELCPQTPVENNEGTRKAKRVKKG